MELKYGYFYNTGTIWTTRCNDNSIRILYMETKPVYSKDINARTRSGFQEVGRYYYQTDRSAKKGTNES